MNKLFNIMIVLVLLVIPIGLAIKPVTQLSTGDGQTIEYPKITHIPYGSDFKLHFHVYNTSGFLKTNTSTNCSFHLYDKYGNHIIENEAVEFDSNGVDFKIDLNKSILNYIGEYSYIMGCNCSKEGGFVSVPFAVTRDGRDTDTRDTSSSIAIIIFLLTITIGLFIFPFINTKLVEDKFINLILRRGCWILSILLLWLDTSIIANISSYSYPELTDSIINIYMFWLGWAAVILLGYMGWRLIIDTINLWRIDKDQKRGILE